MIPVPCESGYSVDDFCRPIPGQCIVAGISYIDLLLAQEFNDSLRGDITPEQAVKDYQKGLEETVEKRRLRSHRPEVDNSR